MKCMNIGLLCAQQIKSDRPTMETVLLMLNSDKITRPIISPPDYYMNKFRITRSEFSSSPKRSGSHVIEIEWDGSQSNFIQSSIPEPRMYSLILRLTCVCNNLYGFSRISRLFFIGQRKHYCFIFKSVFYSDLFPSTISH